MQGPLLLGGLVRVTGGRETKCGEGKGKGMKCEGKGAVSK
jgi:hypothetical protein